MTDQAHMPAKPEPVDGNLVTDPDEEDAFGILFRTAEKRQLVIRPLPPPAELREYQAINPEIVKFWISNWDNESKSRRRRHWAALWFDFVPIVLSQIFGFSLGLTVLLVSADLIRNGHGAVGIAAIISAIAGLATAFVYGRRKTPRLQEKSLESDAYKEDGEDSQGSENTGSGLRGSSDP